MPNIPSTQENVDTALAFLESELNQSSALNDKAFLQVLARLHGVTKSEMYQFASERTKQVLVDTAQGQDLIDLAANYGVPQKQGEPASLKVLVPGTEGTEVPVTSTWIGRTNGIRYYQNLSATVVGGFAEVTINAETTGRDGNLKVGDTVDFGGDTVEGINPEATVSSVEIAGADPETIEELRVRLKDIIRAETGGSNQADVRIWAQGAPNVFRAYPYTGSINAEGNLDDSEPGERVVFIQTPTSYDPDGYADAPVLAAARDFITYEEGDTVDGRTRQALGSIDSLLDVRSITRRAFIFTVRGLYVPPEFEIAAKADIETAMSEYTAAITPYIQGLDSPVDKSNVITSVAASEVVQDVVRSYGGYATGVSFGIVADTFMDSYEMNVGELADSSVEYAV
jgi:uncharacterized phage protein gp47/JayE